MTRVYLHLSARWNEVRAGVALWSYRRFKRKARAFATKLSEFRTEESS